MPRHDLPDASPGPLRQVILAAARHLFTTRGYEATRIADVAAAADVAVGSVYRYFRDKPALLAAVHDEYEARFLVAMHEAAAVDHGVDHAKRVRAVVAALFDTAAREPDLLAMLALAPQQLVAPDMTVDGAATVRLPGARLQAAIAEMLAAGVRDGRFAAVDVAITSALAHGAVEGALRRCFAVDHGRERERYVDETTAALLRMVGASPPTRSAPPRAGRTR